MQEHVATLVGIAAKKKGHEKDWRRTQTLWWNGEPIDRHSQDYQVLLDVAYEALFQNEKFRNALYITGDAVLTHNIGKTNPSETILTQKEFCSRLMSLRKKI